MEKDVNLNKIITGLDICSNTMTAREGFIFAKKICGELAVEIADNPEGGLIIKIDRFTTIHVFQPYSDIDRIYYES
jgi:hypothetical protein